MSYVVLGPIFLAIQGDCLFVDGISSFRHVFLCYHWTKALHAASRLVSPIGYLAEGTIAWHGFSYDVLEDLLGYAAMFTFRRLALQKGTCVVDAVVVLLKHLAWAESYR